MMENDLSFLTNWTGSLPFSIISLTLIGFFSGIISSYLGLGGGFIFTPTFHALIKLPAIDAIATSVAHIPPTMLSAAIKYRKNINFQFAAILLVSAIPVSQLTAFLWGSFNDTTLGKTRIYQSLNVNDLVTIIFFLLILSSSYILSWREKNIFLDIPLKGIDKSQIRYILVVTGILTGLFSALLGIGGGFILVPVFLSLLRTDSITATATSVFTIIPITLLTAIHYFFMGKVHLFLAILAALGGFLGAQIGSWLALKAKQQDHKKLLRLFHGVIIIFYLTLRFFL